MSPAYEYQTLGPNKIRLLYLFAGDEIDDLAGTLEAFTLVTTTDDTVEETADAAEFNSPPPAYKALSYFWGRDDPTEKLWLTYIKSGPAKPYLSIKPNLAHALKKLRRDIEPGKQMIIWTDAICINQTDKTERNGQIRKMADIYSEATEVHIWLGDEEEDSDSAMKFAREIKNPKYFQQALTDDRAAEWLAFRKLIHRDWFSRRWIVQEISLARSAVVHCGKESMAWDDLEEAVSILAASHSEVRNQVRASKLHGNPLDFLGEIKGMGALHLVEIASNVTQRTPTGDRSVMEHRMTLEELMSSLTMFETSDPYDIVYALLWLARDVRPGAALNNVNVIRTPRLSPVADASFNSPTSTTTTTKRYLDVHQGTRNHRRKPSVSEVLKKVEQRKNGKTEKLVVDYNMSLFDCYKKFLEHVFRQSKSLDIICRAWALDPKDQPPERAPPHWAVEESLPTWIKTLDDNKIFDLNSTERVYERIRADPLVGKPGTWGRPYNACGKRKHEGSYTTFEGGGRCLTTRGFTLGDIRECGDRASKGSIPESWLKTLGWTSQPFKKEQAHSVPLGVDGRPDWLWRFLVAEKGDDGYQPPPMRFRSTCTWLLDHRTPKTGLETDLKTRSSWPLLAGEFVDRVRVVVWNRRLIRISLGSNDNVLFGMAPEEAEAGDVVCILFGCSVPVVLRKAKSVTRVQSFAMIPGSTTPSITVEVPDQQTEESAAKRQRLDTSVPLWTSENVRLLQSPLHSEDVNVSEDGMSDSDMSQEMYEFIGECYVYGMMAGEAFKHREDYQTPNRYWHLV